MGPLQKENVTQAVIIADNFNDIFCPISDDIPLALIPVVNKPLLDYTLDFLSLGGIEETFLFCCSHIEMIKEHISKSLKDTASWTLTMKVNIIVSESCRSFGDCLRDLDAKGLIRGDFVLLEPGVVSNIKLLPIIKKHNATTQSDKGAAMTLIYQKAGVGQRGRCPTEEVLLACNSSNRILFHKKLGLTSHSKINLPLDILIDNPNVSIRYDLRDTHIAVCSQSVLPLFADNFDFQTRDDFVKGLLMNEEILGSTLYWHQVTGNQYGAAITNWRMYQAVSLELMQRWVYPILPPLSKVMYSRKNVVMGVNTSYGEGTDLERCVIGDNVKIGKNVKISDSYIFSNTIIKDQCTIVFSVIGPECVVGENCTITCGSIIGKGVQLGKNLPLIEDALVQATKPELCNPGDKLGEKAYRKHLDDEEDDTDILAKKLSRLHLGQDHNENIDELEELSDSDDDSLSYTQSPVPDDTKLFFTEVVDSLTRGFEDELQCDNLILEINSSRYAYNVTVKEVNYNVIKAILHMSLRQPIGPQYYSYFQRLLVYFSPILKNYIRNEEAMIDCLQALENVATSHDYVNEKWVMFVLNWLYNKDHLTEEIILNWFEKLDPESSFYAKVKPFTDWLQQAEEESSDDSD